MDTEEINIRVATTEDLPSIEQIYRSALHQDSVREPQSWPSLIDARHVLVAKRHERTIGFGSIDINSQEQIRHLYVLPSHQRTGAGSAILAVLESIARRNGVEMIKLHSSPNAVEFYEKAGYTAIEYGATSAHDHPGITMSKQLGRASPVYPFGDRRG